jgi:hypothetical protein
MIKLKTLNKRTAYKLEIKDKEINLVDRIRLKIKELLSYKRKTRKQIT